MTSNIPRWLGLAVLVSLAPRALADLAPAEAIDLRGCSEQNVALVYPAALYKKLLPAGFRFPGPTAQILVSGAQCASANGGGASSDLLVFMEVVPAAAYLDPAVSLYAIALGGFSDDPVTTARFANAGFGDTIVAGSVQVTTVAHPALKEQRGHVVAGSGDGQVLTSQVVFGPVTTVPAARTRLFAVKDGAVVGIADGTYTAHPGLAGLGSLLKSGTMIPIPPVAATVATSETGFDLLITPVPLPNPAP